MSKGTEARSREVNLFSVLLLKNKVQGGVGGRGRLVISETRNLGREQKKKLTLVQAEHTMFYSSGIY